MFGGGVVVLGERAGGACSRSLPLLPLEVCVCGGGKAERDGTLLNRS